MKRISWICTRCRANPGSLRRYGMAAAVPTADAKYGYEDGLLRNIFDSPTVWQDFRSHTSSPGKTTGLFLNNYLKTASGFDVFTQRNLALAKQLTTEVAKADNPVSLRMAVKNLDRLSDLLCTVIDLAEFVRTLHPDGEFVAAAERAYDEMYEFMNVLNTHVGLYNSLHRVVNSDIAKHLSTEEHAVAMIFLRDFERSGITLPLKQRKQFVSLSSTISMLGRRFLAGSSAETKYLNVEASKLKGLDPNYIMTQNRSGVVPVPLSGGMADTALRTIENADVRRQIFIASNTSSSEQIDVLEQLLHARAEMAQTLGRANYAELALEDKMAKSPEAVGSFLSALAKSNLSEAQRELRSLDALRVSSTVGTSNTPFAPWDRDYYAARLLLSKRARCRSSEFLMSYFSLGTVMQGLSRLFTHQYGVRLVPRTTSIGEVWTEDVRRLDVISEDDGIIGMIYCDLFQRQGKSPSPAHYTVRCSRRIDGNGDAREDAELDGEACSVGSDGASHQLPTIALVCDFQQGGKDQPTLLNFHEVETIFHEMGHAIHSMLGRTVFHNIAGTRCATDFVELPSVLMEHFAASPPVLSLFARHYATDDPLPTHLLQQQLDIQSSLRAIENHAQIMMAILDQAYHSDAPSKPGFNSTAIWHDVEREWRLLPPVDETSWQGWFGHLYGYGATYYSYLFDRAIAAKVWSRVFANDPLSRESGEKFRGEVLRWGGGRDPWHCIAGVLDLPDLRDGNEAAMTEVGHWGRELNSVQ